MRLDERIVNEISNLRTTVAALQAKETPLQGTGTAFPTGAVPTGFRYFRTDLNAEFTFDGTYWLGPEVMLPMLPIIGVAWPITVGTIIYTSVVPFDMRITNIYANVNTSIINNGVNFWSFNFNNVLTGTQSSMGGFNTAAGTVVNQTKRFSLAISPGTYANSTSFSDISAVATPANSSSGNITAYCGLTYRRIMY